MHQNSIVKLHSDYMSTVRNVLDLVMTVAT